MNTDRLLDKVIVVAGGGSGIGAATALRLGAEGARVLVGDIDADRALATATTIADAGGVARSVAFDLADEASVQNLIRSAVNEYGRLNGLFNVGADLSPATLGQDSNVVDVALDVWHRTLDVNLTGYMLTMRAAIPVMLETGGGAIVNTVSGLVLGGDDERPSYGASKGALIPLTLHVARRWGKRGIRCNTLAPGIVLTESQLSTISDEHRASVLERLPSPRFGQPEDIAAMAALLLSDDGAWVNGQLIAVNGGSVFH